MNQNRIFVCILALLLCFRCLIYPMQVSGLSVWAQEDVETAIQLGLVPSHLQEAYDTPITRQEFCQVLAAWIVKCQKENCFPEQSWETVSFSDTDDPAVTMCAGLGIVNGVGESRFSPDNPISRQEAAVILSRAAQILADLSAWEKPYWQYPHVFSDGAQISSWAREAITWSYRTGILQGTSGDKFSPLQTYTREQTYCSILRLYRLVKTGDSGVPTPQEYYPWEGGYVDLTGQEVTDYPLDGCGITPYYVSGQWIYDAHGNAVLDLGPSGVWHRTVSFHGAIAFVRDSLPYVYNLKTSEKLENVTVEESANGVLTLFHLGTDWHYTYLMSDGSQPNPNRYRAAGRYWDNLAIAQLPDLSFVLIDETGAIVKYLDIDSSLRLYSACGKQAVFTDETGFALYHADMGFLTPMDRAYGTVFDNGQAEIRYQSRYTLYDQTGSIVVENWETGFRSVSPTLYLHLTEGSTYTLVSSHGQELATLQFVRKEPDLKQDGGGLMAYLETDSLCKIVDSQGNLIATIDDGRTLNWSASGFQNGLLYLYGMPGVENADTSLRVYLPNGQLLSHFPHSALQE